MLLHFDAVHPARPEGHCLHSDGFACPGECARSFHGWSGPIHVVAEEEEGEEEEEGRRSHARYEKAAKFRTACWL
eukprot:1536011-Alexandrium_andersonii.AAC.1